MPATGPITKDASTWVLGLMQIRIGAAATNISTTTAVLTAANSIGALRNTRFTGDTAFFDQMSGFPKRKDGSIPLSEAAKIEGAFKEITPFNMAMARGLDPSASVDPQVQEEVSKVSTAGTTTGNITVDAGAGWGVIDDEWTVLFESATSGLIIGKDTGHIHDFANLTSAMEPVHDSTLKYFSIPANFFSGTWAADEIYVFHTLAGGDSTYASAHSGNLGLGGLVAPVDIRVESVYTYPNGTNTMTFIFPRSQVMAQMETDFAEESEAAVPVTFESQNASSDNAAGNPAWDSMPLGRIIWA